MENSETGRSVRERLAVILIGLSSFKKLPLAYRDNVCVRKCADADQHT